ncbi:MAG: LacI family DNA-binding transcriptional regulator [Gammaproteobacteria bacterium]|nr:LacI family DNA-binding transcriptional regulator [Gammaproteobacteria bacterium]
MAKDETPVHKSPTKPTVHLVAKLAKVSPSTVSRVLTGQARVTLNKVVAVQLAIKQLGFRPDYMARSLVLGKSMSIGVVTPFIDSPYYAEALRGIEIELHQAHYVPLFISGHWQEKEEIKGIEVLLQRKVDGIIVLDGQISDNKLLDLALQVPTVIIGRNIQAPKLQSIDFENFEGTRLAVKHLYRQGHSAIAYISGLMDRKDARLRLKGYEMTMLELGLGYDKDWIVQGNFQESSGVKATNTLLELKQNFTAIICANDQMAYGARLALHQASLRVPDDISLIGFDDLPHSAFTLPPLTTVKHSMYNMGVEAAKAMFSLINGENLTPTLIKADLIIRESTRILKR